MISIKTKRPARPSFAGLPCQIRPAAIRLRALMKAVAMRRKQTPIEIAVRGAAVMPQASRDELQLVELAALDSMARGAGTVRDLQKLADVSNVAGVLCKVFKVGGRDTAIALIEGEIAIINCAARMELTGVASLDGADLEAVREMLSWSHAQRDVVGRKVYLDALKLTMAQIKGNHNTIDLNQACAAINGRGE